MKAAMPLTEYSEKAWQNQVVSLCKQLGWRKIYHTYRSTRSMPGWPDLALVRDRLILLEVKTEAGKLSGHQQDWLAALIDAGVETYVVRPSDLQFLADVLQLRHRPLSHPLEHKTLGQLGRLQQSFDAA